VSQQARILRVLTFAPATFGSTVDDGLRRVRADLRSTPGVVDVHLGRRQGAVSERTIVSRWTSFEAMTAALGPASGTTPVELSEPALAADAQVEVRPIAFNIDGADDTAAVVLRVFRGTLHAGELEAYVEDARAGTYTDIAADRGPISLALAIDPPDRFMTVSLWDGWDRLSTATGGSLRQPIMTRHAHRLADWTASHYEVIPASAEGPVVAHLAQRLAET
jgi:hypothetical protein